MMPGNNFFYAYVYNVHNHDHTRFVVVFASRYVADEWWRVISTHSKVAGSAQRLSPQFYTHNSNKANLLNFFEEPIFKNIVPQFEGRMFITCENRKEGPGRGVSSIPEQEIVDHLNGKLFYIRSKHDPNLFWNYAYSSQYVGGEVSVSTVPIRSRFRIIAADAKLPKGTVLIGSDRVIIQITEGLYVTVSETNRLVSSNQQHEFLFSDLAGGKFALTDDTNLAYSTSQLDDEWELA